MRKFSILLSILVLATMVLAACGGEETATNLPSTQVPQTTADTTETMTEPATESPTAAGTEEATATAGIPVTGEVNPARVSNQLDFTVWSQDGEQIGEVDDMVLDLENARIAYVVVGTAGFLDLGDREILVPWDSLQLQTGTGQGTGQATATAETGAGQATATSGTGTGQATQSTDQATATSGTEAGTGQATATSGVGTGTGDSTGGQENVFILQGDVEMFRNAPDFDLSTLPAMGQPAGDWDVVIRVFWEGGGTSTGQATATTGAGQATATGGADQGQATATMEAGQATATSGAGTGQGQATATTAAGAGQATATSGTGTGTGQATATAGTGTGQGTGEAATWQGVALASEVIGSTITLGDQTQGQGQATATSGTGTGTGQATATSGAGTGQATATTAAGQGQATATSGTGTGQATATTGAGAAQATATSGTGTGTDQDNATLTIEDLIAEPDTGIIWYVVVSSPLMEDQRWIPIPLRLVLWNPGEGALVVRVDPPMLQNAPSFQEDQFPDATVEGWNSEFETFWQNNGGSGTEATATATP